MSQPMKNENKTTYKDLIFARYIGQFLQANETDATVRKSSEEIAFELSGMAHYSTDEISVAMIGFQYRLGFEDSKPVWLLKENPDKKIKE